MPLSGREKATILLSLLGTEMSEKILETLPPDIGDSITSLITSLPNPSSDVIAEVLREFSEMMLPEAPQRKAIEEAPQQSYQQQNTERVEQPVPKSPFDVIFYAHPKQVAASLSAERGAVAAFVIALLPPVQAGEVMSHMTERRKEIEDMLRIIKKNSLSDKITERILPILSDRIERMAYGR